MKTIASDNKAAEQEAIKIFTDEQNGVEYFSFGNGKKDFIILPGLSIAPVSEAAAYVAGRYKALTEDFRITLFDRPMSPPREYSIRDIANDLAKSMNKAGIGNAVVLGSSQGGMIAQQLAVDHPDMVSALVLCATTCKVEGQAYETIERWVRAAEEKDKKTLAMLVINGIYSPAAAKAVENDMVKMISKVSDALLKRFVILGKSCLAFDLSESVSQIKCKTLVLGTEGDKVTLPDGAKTIAKLIKGSELHMYGKEYGHCIVDEVPDLPEKVKAF
ncbi:MAG TPA: hypothetical protein DCO86_03600, partial [Spirochaetaceae bacterium]|nr:hypothetical protein [Spirochaetaceae bacterium]